jgi:hypothetical protein
MKTKVYILILAAVLIGGSGDVAKACNICGGGTSDIAVLAIDGRMLFNVGFLFDHYNGVWDQNGTWRPADYTTNQYKTLMAFAYRMNKHFQIGLVLPYVFNTTNSPNVTKQNGSGVGDMTISSRYEFFHEFQLRNTGSKKSIDSKTPYLALILGVTIPTGKSDENAKYEADITGKGFFSTNVGISVTKSIVRNRLQLSADLSWQHGFNHQYDKYFGETVSPFTKRPGDKINYDMTANYIFGSEHALALTVMGFSQGSYVLNNNNTVTDSEERNFSFAMAYTYYPHVQFRITPSIKWNLPGDNLGRNAIGTTTFNINFTYYIPDYSIK